MLFVGGVTQSCVECVFGCDGGVFLLFLYSQFFLGPFCQQCFCLYTYQPTYIHSCLNTFIRSQCERDHTGENDYQFKLLFYSYIPDISNSIADFCYEKESHFVFF